MSSLETQDKGSPQVASGSADPLNQPSEGTISHAWSGAHPYSALSQSSKDSSPAERRQSLPRSLAHPYERTYVSEQSQRRIPWNPAFGEMIGGFDDVRKMPARQRRAIYQAALESHIDQIHEQCLSLGLSLTRPDALKQYQGMDATWMKVSMFGFAQHT